MAIPLEAMEGIIDLSIFEQLLEMDEDGDHEFSKSIAEDYFDQAEGAFDKMDAALSESPTNLSEAGKIGHFLKGSSAAIGVIRVRDNCEKIQHWGALKDPIAGTPISKEDAESLITSHLEQARAGFSEAKRLLQRYFGMEVDEAASPIAEVANSVAGTEGSEHASSLVSPSSASKTYSETHSEASPTRSIHSNFSQRSPSPGVKSS